MNRLLVLCLFGFSATFFVGNVHAALDAEGIVGGEDAELGDFPYQVSLKVVGKSICGGSIIDDTHVVTAAHCVISEEGKFFGYPMKVVGGIADLKSKGSSRVAVDVVKVYATREYDPTNVFARPHGDIAVLKLAKPLGIASNPNLDTIELPNPSKTYAGEKAVISGFGWNYVNLQFNPSTGGVEETGGGGYGKMRFADVDIISQSKCQRLARAISKNHICGMVVQRSAKPEGVCSGDSGGPLVAGDKTLIGVVSTSPLGCRENKEPAVYTRVSEYIDFVKKALKGQTDSSIRTTTLPIY
ncbi:chymotrypsin-1-like [Nasonia vitripennis]|uniref:Peptidase S1 domain-containing protein n=1 Tax=Nasonia vitripennis TaxID=7425 RepID=A0A7M7HF79_NASVI|nr:chymotrypsin-1-like [Nasonia vitripennis]